LNLRKELKLNVIDAAKLLALVVLLSDDYLKFKQIDDINQKAIRFFQINLKLPLELQTIICNYVFEHFASSIKTQDFNQGMELNLTNSNLGFLKREVKCRAGCTDSFGVVPIEDRHNGCMVCPVCGFVIEDIIDDGAEYRFFQDDDGVDKRRVEFESDYYSAQVAPQLALEVRLEGGKGEAKNLARVQQNMNKKSISSAASNMLANLKFIESVCAKLALTQNVKDTASDLLIKAKEDKRTKGRPLESLALACIICSTQINHVPREIALFANTFDKDAIELREVVALIKKILPERFQKVVTLRAQAVAPLMCQELGMDEKFRTATELILRNITNLSLLEGKKPKSVASATIYFVSILASNKISFEALEKVSGVTQPTIRGVYKILYENKAKIAEGLGTNWLAGLSNLTPEK